MKKYVDVYKQCMYSAIQTASAYRMNFIVSSLITLIGNILFPLVTLLIYRAGTSFPGWSLYEVLLIQSIFTMSSGLSSLVFGGLLWTTMSHVREGSFEVILLRPLNPLFYIVATTFCRECRIIPWRGCIIHLLRYAYWRYLRPRLAAIRRNVPGRDGCTRRIIADDGGDVLQMGR